MKQLSELKEGKCAIVTEFQGSIKEYEGSYNAKLNVVFMTIPSYMKILGYKQD